MRPSTFVLKFIWSVLVVLVIAGALALIGSYTFLPPMLENSLARDIKDQLELKREPEVELASKPPYRLLTGEFTSGRVTLEEPEFAGIRSERVTVRLNPFEVGVLRSIGSGKLKPDGRLSGSLRVEVSQHEVRRIIQEGAGDVPVTGVRLEDGRMLVESRVVVLGIQVPVSVEGDLNIDQGKLVFDPKRATALGARVPKEFSRNLVSRSGFSYPLGKLPYGTKVTGVEVERGKVVFSGKARRLVAG